MWIDPTTADIAMLHTDMRRLRPNWSGPAAITDDMIAFLGFVPVVIEIPNYDPVSETATAMAVTLVDGVWTQQWEVVALPDDQAALNKQALADKAASGIDAEVALAADAARLKAAEKETSV